MQTSIREFRASMHQIFRAIQHGEEVTVYLRKKPIAKIIPLSSHTDKKTEDAFGMWKDYAQAIDVPAFARTLRKGRRHDR